MTYILYAVGFLAFLSLCVYFAIKFNDWSEREADRNEKQAKDLQMALLRANRKKDNYDAKGYASFVRRRKK